ncbi:MAG: histidine kinase [Tetrasphaera sp.]
MRNAVDWPTAITVVVIIALGLGAWWLGARVRGRSRGFLSDVDRATYQTLHTAGLAARWLGSGLTPDGTAKAARPLRHLLGIPALAVSDLSGAVTWEGAGRHHAAAVPEVTARTLATGDTAILDHGEISCTTADCYLRAAVVCPIVSEDRVVGALAAYAPSVSAGLARATAEVAGWVSTQVELAELGRERTRATEAELAALRAQISPHFIYNSLGAIASFVRTDPDRARDLLLEFADFTRYALRRGGAYTTLADELRNVERYLVLEQARFGERLQIRLLIAPEVLSVSLPYLAVQPLVENAVRHGLATKEGVGTVTITAADRGSEAEIVIEDDGVGADPARIAAVLDGTDPGDSHGIGNVDSRLRALYGDDHGLVVETAPGAGTRVSFRIPKFAPQTMG